jgi:hypothetical protein
MAETWAADPGVQFVGYMGYLRSVLFWIFLGAPYIEALCGNRRLTGALSAITAAVVGMVCNLAFWFGIHVLFAASFESSFAGGSWTIPEWNTTLVLPSLLAVGSGVALWLCSWACEPQHRA